MKSSLQKTYWRTYYTHIPVYKSSLIKMSFAVSHKGRQALLESQENKKVLFLDSLKKEDISGATAFLWQHRKQLPTEKSILSD